MPGLLAEQVRNVKNEGSKESDDTSYTINNEGSWTTVHDYGSFSLSEDSLIAFSYTAGIRNSASGAEEVNHRLKFGSLVAAGYPQSVVAGTGESYEEDTVQGIIALPAGNHQVVVEGIAPHTYAYFRVKDMLITKVVFSDVDDEDLHEYSSELTLCVDSRTMCFGTFDSALMYILVQASTPSAQTKFEDPGDSFTNGVRIKTAGIQRSWSLREHDDESDVYGSGTAWLLFYHSPDGDRTVTIEKDNANTVVHVSVVFCPWILPISASSIFNFTFSKNSTLYITLEPCMTNPTKYLQVGKWRGFSGSGAYYSEQSGVDILEAHYTFETVDPDKTPVYVKGHGGCISIIGVDVR